MKTNTLIELKKSSYIRGIFFCMWFLIRIEAIDCLKYEFGS